MRPERGGTVAAAAQLEMLQHDCGCYGELPSNIICSGLVPLSDNDFMTKREDDSAPDFRYLNTSPVFINSRRQFSQHGRAAQSWLT